MSSSRRWQAGAAVLLALLASTAACEHPETTTSVGQSVTQSAPPTSLIAFGPDTTAVPASSIGDCVAYVQFAAYLGEPDMAAMWNAANQNVERLRENCMSLGRGDPSELVAISRRRDQLEAMFGASTVSTSDGSSTTVAGSASAPLRS